MTNTYFNTTNYKRFRQLTILWLPFLGWLLIAVDPFVSIPKLERWLGLVMALIFAFGLILNGSTKRYLASREAYDGQMVISEKEDGMKLFSLELDTAPEDMELKDAVTFKVEKAVS